MVARLWLDRERGKREQLNFAEKREAEKSDKLPIEPGVTAG